MLDTGGISCHPLSINNEIILIDRRHHITKEIDMGEKGKKDKGGKEKKKEPQMTLKEKRQAKKEKAKNKDYT